MYFMVCISPSTSGSRSREPKIDNGALRRHLCLCRLISTTQRLLHGQQARDIDYRPHLDGAFTRHGDPSGNANRLVEIICLDEEVAAQLFPRLREWAIGHESFAVAHPDTGR